MDKTEQYIKMSDKAKELWQYRKTLPGDFLVVEGRVYVYPERWAIDSIPLFRQDQLQEMTGYAIAANAFAIADFLRKDGKWLREDLDYINSMEQLWLAFVMKEKYNKVWNGEDWVNA